MPRRIDIESIGKRIRFKRGSISQIALGHSINIDNDTLSKWERWEKYFVAPSLEQLNSIAEALRCNADELLFDEGERNFEVKASYWKGFLEGILLKDGASLDEAPFWDIYWQSLIWRNHALLTSIDKHWAGSKGIEVFIFELQKRAFETANRDYLALLVQFSICLNHYLSNRMKYSIRVHLSICAATAADWLSHDAVLSAEKDRWKQAKLILLIDGAAWIMLECGLPRLAREVLNDCLIEAEPYAKLHVLSEIFMERTNIIPDELNLNQKLPKVSFIEKIEKSNILADYALKSRFLNVRAEEAILTARSSKKSTTFAEAEKLFAQVIDIQENLVPEISGGAHIGLAMARVEYAKSPNNSNRRKRKLIADVRTYLSNEKTQSQMQPIDKLWADLIRLQIMMVEDKDVLLDAIRIRAQLPDSLSFTIEGLTRIPDGNWQIDNCGFATVRRQQEHQLGSKTYYFQHNLLRDLETLIDNLTKHTDSTA